jgi:putative transposase
MEEAIIIKLVDEIRLRMPRIGTRKLLSLLYEPLSQHGVSIGRDKLFNLLLHHGMLVKNRRRKAVATNSNHKYRKYPNLVRNIALERPEQLWVSDITYIRVGLGFSYLSLITDAYSKKIVGYHLSPNLGEQGPLTALTMAIAGRQRPDLPLMHHSDRGFQYCCYSYIEKLNRHKILISMTEKGDPYENAIAERVNGILKVEFGLHKTFRTHAEAYEQVDKVVPIYNGQRPHLSCNYLTPEQAHQSVGVLEKRWKNYPLKRKPKEIFTM